MIATTRDGDEQFFYTLYSVIAIGGFSLENKKSIIELLEFFDFEINEKVTKAIDRYLKKKTSRHSLKKRKK